MDVWIRGIDLTHSIENEVTFIKQENTNILLKKIMKKRYVLKSVEQNKGNFSTLMNQYLETTVFEEDKN